jgi:hypothetical protein
VLDPAKVAGKIVLCDRGVTARTNKSLAVQEAGGIGMVLVNTSANSINADLHFVPTMHLQNTDRAAVKATRHGRCDRDDRQGDDHERARRRSRRRSRRAVRCSRPAATC